MPWKRRSRGKTPGAMLAGLIVLAAAAGVLACLLGSALDPRLSAMKDKYTLYKSVTGSYSPAEINAALQRRAGK